MDKTAIMNHITELQREIGTLYEQLGNSDSPDPSPQQIEVIGALHPLTDLISKVSIYRPPVAEPGVPTIGYDPNPGLHVNVTNPIPVGPAEDVKS